MTTTEHVIEALLEAITTIPIEGAWSSITPEVAGASLGLPFPPLNLVLTRAPTANPDVIEELHHTLVAGGVPFVLMARPGTEHLLDRVAARSGHQRHVPATPLMVRDDATPFAIEPSLDARIRAVAPQGVEHFWQGLADGFEMPLELCRAVWTPEVVASPNSRCFVAEEDGQVVATGQVTVTQQVAGVFCISTIPSHRGRGYGEAITARCVNEGLALGATASHAHG